MIRTHSHYASISTFPGIAVGSAVGGQVFSTGRITSPFMRVVDVREGEGGRVDIKTQGKHKLGNGTRVETCLDGWHGVTDREHPGNVVNTPVVRVDDYWLGLTGTTWVANSVFLHGEVWRTDADMIDSQAPLVALADRVSAAGGGIIELPAGYLGLASTLPFYNNVQYIGQGKGVTRLVAFDWNNSHVTACVASNCGIRRVTVLGHRQRKNPVLGLHAYRAGGDGIGVDNYTVIDSDYEGAAGYGCAFQSSGWFTNCHIDLDGVSSDSDGFDAKNRQNKNFGNYIRMNVRNFGMGRVGLNVPAFTLQNNPVSTQAGSSLVSITRFAEDITPECKVTYEDAPDDIGGIDLNGTFVIVGKVQGGYVISVAPQVASGTVTNGGGAGIKEYVSQISNGDAGIDIRGEGWLYGDCRVEGPMNGRTAFRSRDGNALNTNGTGGVRSSGGTIFLRNTGPSKSSSIGLAIGGWGNNFPSVIVHGFRDGVSFMNNSGRNIVGLAQAYDCTTAGLMRGTDNSIVDLSADSCGTGWAPIGGMAMDREFLPENPFTTVVGSNVMSVITPFNHGQMTGALVTITGGHDDNGVDPNVTGEPITVTGLNSFTVEVSTLATGDTPFGGENAIYSFGISQIGVNLSVGTLTTRNCGVGYHIYEGCFNASIGIHNSNGDTIKGINAGANSSLPDAPFHPDVYKWASKVIQNGGATNDTEMANINAFVEAQGLIHDKAYDYNLWGATADSIASRMSLKLRVLAIPNGPTFHPLQGWKGDGVDDVIDTGVNVRTIMDADGRGHMFAYALDDVAGGAKTVMGVGGGSALRLRLRSSDDHMGGQMISAQGAFAETITTTSGYASIQRDATATLSGNKDGTSLADITVGTLATLPPDNNMWVLGFNSGSGLQEPCDNLVFATGLSRPLSILEVKRQAANLEALYAAVTAGEPPEAPAIVRPSLKPVYVEEAYGVDPTGRVDSTDRWKRALASGRKLLMIEKAVYRISAALPLRGSRVHGDKSQTFRQYTQDNGFFEARRGTCDGSEIHDINVEYMLDRSAGPGSVLQYRGLSNFQQNCGLWAEADHLRVRNLKTVNCFTQVALRGPVATTNFTITAITKANPAVITLAEGTAALSALAGGARCGVVSGVAGMTEMNGKGNRTITVLNGTDISIPGVNSTSYATYTGGGVLPIYDFSGQATDIEIVNLHGDTCDLGVTGGQYDRGLIDGLTLDNQTEYTVPPHIIYINNPNALVAVSNFTIRRVKGTNAPANQPFVKISDIRDSTLENCDVKESDGYLWSNAFDCRMVACNATEIPDGGVGTNFTYAGKNNQMIGGVMSFANGAEGYGVQAEDASEWTVIGTEYVTDYSGGDDGIRGFRAEHTSKLRLVDVTGRHLQSNNGYLAGAVNTAQISGTIASNVGAPGLIRVGDGATATLRYDRRLCPDYVAGAASIRVDSGGTLNGRQFGVLDPILIGSVTPGSHSYGPSSDENHWSREGAFVMAYVSLRLTAFDGAMAGEAWCECLPFDASDAGADVAPYARPSVECSAVDDMLLLPSSGPATIKAEVIEGTKLVRFYYSTAATTKINRTYLTAANFTNTSELGFVITYRTDAL